MMYRRSYRYRPRRSFRSRRTMYRPIRRNYGGYRPRVRRRYSYAGRIL